MSRTVELRIAGQNYRVVSSAPEEELHRLAGVVSAKLVELVPKGRALPAQAIVLAAISLAHEAETERCQREALERRTRDVLKRSLARIDEALAGGGTNGLERDEPGEEEEPADRA